MELMRRLAATLLIIVLAVPCWAQFEAFSQNTQASYVLKAILGIRYTGQERQSYEEALDQVGGVQVWNTDMPNPAVLFPSTPPGADTSEIDVQNAMALVADGTFGTGRAYCASSSTCTSGILKDWIPPKFGLGYGVKILSTTSGTTTANAVTSITGSSTSFTTQLQVGDSICLSSASRTCATVTGISSNTALTVGAALGNGTSQSIYRVIPPSSQCGPLFDYKSGVLAFDSAVTSVCGSEVAHVAPIMVNAYRFIGKYTSEVASFTNQSSTPPTPGTGRSSLYVKDGVGLQMLDEHGVVFGPYYGQVQDEGSDLAPRATINFAGTGVTCADGSGKTTCTVSGGGGGTVTAVTASSPLSSSGGSTPDISLASAVPMSLGGTNQTSWTASRCVQVNSGGTALEAAAAACGGAPEVQDETYNSTNFNGDTTHAVSQDDLYDQLHLGDADDDGLPDVLDSVVTITAAAAPSTPASGKGAVYVDSTSKNLAVKDDAGVVKHGAQTMAATTSQWLRSMDDAGLFTKSQPAFTDISGSVASGQMPTSATDLYYGDGSDGDLTVSVDTVLLPDWPLPNGRDMFYNNLTVQTGKIFWVQNHTIYVAGILDLQGTGQIRGGNPTEVGTGGSASGATAGVGHLIFYSQSTDGATGTNGVGAQGVLPLSGVGEGGSGGYGGAGSSSGSAGGARGTGASTQVIRFRGSPLSWEIPMYSTAGTAGRGGSAGGGNGGANTGGGGGGGGCGGRNVLVRAKAVTGSGKLRSVGYDGGAGGSTATSKGGGGGGGGGGQVFLYTNTSSPSITLESIGGAGGAAGGAGAEAGATGSVGSTVIINPRLGTVTANVGAFTGTDNGAPRLHTDSIRVGDTSSRFIDMTADLFEVRSTVTPQVRFSYDTDNHMDFYVNSTGTSFLDIVGTTPAFSFLDPAVLAAGVDISTSLGGTIPLVVSGAGAYDIQQWKDGLGSVVGRVDHIGMASFEGMDAGSLPVTHVADGSASDDAAAYHQIADYAQPVDSDLTSFAGLGSAADKGVYTTAAHTWAEFDLTSFSRGVLANGSASLWRSALSLGTFATENTSTAPNITSSGSQGSWFVISTRDDITGIGATTVAAFTFKQDSTSNASLAHTQWTDASGNVLMSLVDGGTSGTLTTGSFSATTGTFSSTISGSNFSGTSSGTNTGDQVLPTGANPTASLGLSAVNGSSSNFMRADAAPALSQSIVPTWTGVHTHSATPIFNAGLDLGTSGRVDSNVADAAAAVSFLVKPTVGQTSGTDRYIYALQNSAGTAVHNVLSNLHQGFGQLADGSTQVYTYALPSGDTSPVLIGGSPSMSGAGATIAGQTNAVANTSFAVLESASGTWDTITGAAFTVNLSAGRNKVGAWGAIFRADMTGNNGFTTTDMGGIHVIGNSTGSSMTGTITNWYGIKIENTTKTTNAYGLYIAEQNPTTGGTIKNGIFLANATSGYKAMCIRDQTACAGSDAAGYFDIVAGRLREPAGGASSLKASVGGAIFVSTSTEGNTAATETDACSQSIAASTLGADGDSVEFYAGGTFAVGAADRIKAKFGATTIFDSGALNVAGASSWEMHCAIIRTGAATQKATCSMESSSAALASSASYTAPAETLSGAITLKLTVNGTLANAAVKEMCKGTWTPAP